MLNYTALRPGDGSNRCSPGDAAGTGSGFCRACTMAYPTVLALAFLLLCLAHPPAQAGQGTTLSSVNYLRSLLASSSGYSLHRRSERFLRRALRAYHARLQIPGPESFASLPEQSLHRRSERTIQERLHLCHALLPERLSNANAPAAGLPDDPALKKALEILSRIRNERKLSDPGPRSRQVPDNLVKQRQDDRKQLLILGGPEAFPL